MKSAVIYLRVSTVDQANTDSDPEGYSIAAQREACLRRASELEAPVVDEYTDRGESARSANRPELQRLLSDLRSSHDIGYVIVHKVDRLARSVEDDVAIGLAIQKAGAQLVSVTEKIDETPAGRLLHGIMAVIAEFYSRNLAAEALKGATEKAKRGGTPYLAPIGYLNVIRHIDDHEVRIVEVDPDRAPLVQWAFERYATGDYSLRRLEIELAATGLRTRRTPRYLAQPLRHSRLHKMLGSRYYLGMVTYQGQEYPGRHEPLISPQLFARVVAVSSARHKTSIRSLHHYLRGTVRCGRCKAGLSYTIAKKRYGYFY